MLSRLEELATTAIAFAATAGATRSDCLMTESASVVTTVRAGIMESIKRSNSCVCSIWAERQGRWASAYTSDLTRTGLKEAAAWAVALTDVSEDQPDAEPVQPDAPCLNIAELRLHFPEALAGTEYNWVENAAAAEHAAFESDPRIETCQHAAYTVGEGSRMIANSLGFLRGYRFSTCSLSIVVIAKDGASKERDSWHSLARRPAALDAPTAVGATAAARAVRRLHPRRPPSGRFPVVFDANTSRAILNYFGECVNGLAVVRGTTFLSGKLGERVASSRLSVVNDPTFPELLGTYPFDDEGTSGRRTIIVHEGILQNYLLNSYAARRLGMPSTGSAGRGLGGKAFVIQANFHAIPGSHTETSLVRDAKTGLYITELLGHGLNAQTGDFSIGAAGFYIEHGEIVYPVSGFAIAGNFGVLLRNIDGVGNELKPNGPTASPPLLVSGLTVSGR